MTWLLLCWQTNPPLPHHPYLPLPASGGARPPPPPPQPPPPHPPKDSPTQDVPSLIAEPPPPPQPPRPPARGNVFPSKVQATNPPFLAFTSFQRPPPDSDFCGPPTPPNIRGAPPSPPPLPPQLPPPPQGPPRRSPRGCKLVWPYEGDCRGIPGVALAEGRVRTRPSEETMEGVSPHLTLLPVPDSPHCRKAPTAHLYFHKYFCLLLTR